MTAEQNNATTASSPPFCDDGCNYLRTYGSHEKVEGEEKENTGVKHVKKDEGEFLESEKQLPVVKVVDVEKHLYMSVAPDPDILIRTSGETCLSNFLLRQTSNCPLYSPAALWPDLGLRHLVWAILNFQRNHYYLEKKRKQM
ncbi:dehydrodolichyl diphosphate synthase 6-like [Pyrus x bretschneideri]|uniref:dehydrodolichyl diphosphate synthase 6-like n=1 Tax=Pyrus x bretschneideri TaxID=225117 RepID=UPI00202F08D1|nr:dehydrodolichyl diphosphate synthase 6-like [Pyrus x bretschneideri]